MREIILSEIRPFGNLASTLETFEKNVIMCEKEGYTKEVARLCKLLYEFGFLDPNEWFDEIETEEERPEIEMIVLFPRVLFIRLNNIAQKDLNGIKMKPIAEQLMDDKDFMKYFPNTIFK
jgi:hypothetical protein